jgi:peptidoglycan/LPS O-acetylase OafA/YrhL
MTTATITTIDPPARTTSPGPTWRTGAVAGLVAAAATMAVAAAAGSLGVSLETAPGETIPVIGFGQLTLFFTMVGVVIARVLGRRARQPRTMFIRTTVALTALSLIPDVLLHAEVATKLTLIATHLVAAAIVIPALAGRPDTTPSELR